MGYVCLVLFAGGATVLGWASRYGATHSPGRPQVVADDLGLLGATMMLVGAVGAAITLIQWVNR